MPAAHPKEFRDDVVAVARRGEAPIAQLAKDFGISESCLRNWLHQADVEDGHRPGVTKAENEELREARKKIRLLEQAPVLSRRVCQKRPPVPQGMVGALSWCEGEVLILQRRHGGPSCGGQISGAALTDRLVPTPVALR